MSALYQCRRCDAKCDPSWEEVQFGRIVCAFCGGTCDPTPQEQKKLNLLRQLKNDKDFQAAWNAAGLATNQYVGRDDEKLLDTSELMRALSKP